MAIAYFIHQLMVIWAFYTFLANMNNAAVNIAMHVSALTCVFLSFVYNIFKSIYFWS